MKNKIIIQIAHITSTPGPVQFLAEYLKNKTDNFYQIYHSLDAKEKNNSVFLKNDKIVEKKKPAGYLFNFFRTISWLSKANRPVDLAIGMNCFDTLPLIIMKKKYRIRKIIFFNTDFSRQRFDNFFFNKIYVWLDKFCAQKADMICCNTRRTILQRIKEGVNNNKIVYTPNGVFLDKIGKIDIVDKKFARKLLFIGHFSKEHGLASIFEVLAENNLKLEIIGSGPEKENLENLVAQKGLEDKIFFLGHKKHSEVIKYLKNFGGFGLAPYQIKSDWTWYCDPVKVKEYLSCLVPTVISDVPEIAEEVENLYLGMIFKNEEDLRKIFKKVSQMDDQEYKKYLENIKKVRQDFDLSKIYKKIYA